ncbi:MAG: M20/M25/M40 family metallo-hydrolase [Candidatus Omnitrophota bacterium]
MLRLIIIAVFAFLIFKSSTFGWRLFVKAKPKTNDADIFLSQRLKHHVLSLSDYIGERHVFTKYENLDKAANYITRTFQDHGYSVSAHTYKAYSKISQNIIATKLTEDNPKEIIVIGAHYDSVLGSPGADDNASGVAVLLETAKFLKDSETKQTIKFIAFVNEEPPFFKSKDMGSFAYLEECLKNKERISSAIILESVGFYSQRRYSQRYPPLFGIFYPDRANFIALVSNFKSRHLLKALKQSFSKNSTLNLETISTFDFVPGVDFSDNWSFWQKGIPAIMITDTAFYRNPYYHTAQDTAEKLDYDFMTLLAKDLSISILELANK